MSSITDLREIFGDVKISFLASAAKLEQCPTHSGREFALLGRSNVGKSSFINHIFFSQGIAKVSKQPGKTRLANFFTFTEEILFVDLPGYGYARVSHDERSSWSKMMKTYLEQREQLAGIIWLLDYRREEGTDIDKEAAAWLAKLQIPVFVVLTKSDKLTQKEQANNRKSIIARYSLDKGVPIIGYSVTKEGNRMQFWKQFHAWITNDEI